MCSGVREDEATLRKSHRVQDTFRTRLGKGRNPFNPEITHAESATVSQFDSTPACQAMTKVSCIRHGAWKGGPALVALSQTRQVAGLVDVEVEVITARLVPQSSATSVPGILTRKYFPLTRPPSGHNDLRYVVP